jgi:hypothetical protein
MFHCGAFADLSEQKRVWLARNSAHRLALRNRPGDRGLWATSLLTAARRRFRHFAGDIVDHHAHVSLTAIVIVVALT